MTFRLAALLSALLLCGCVSDTFVVGEDLAMVSEACRASAATQVTPAGPIKSESAGQKHDDFERLYHGCMAQRGY